MFRNVRGRGPPSNAAEADDSYRVMSGGGRLSGRPHSLSQDVTHAGANTGVWRRMVLDALSGLGVAVRFFRPGGHRPCAGIRATALQALRYSVHGTKWRMRTARGARSNEPIP